MSQEGSSYEDVLKEAQDLGYAERNPEADVEGYDTCRKIAILTSLAFGSTVSLKKSRQKALQRFQQPILHMRKSLAVLSNCLQQALRKMKRFMRLQHRF